MMPTSPHGHFCHRPVSAIRRSRQSAPADVRSAKICTGGSQRKFRIILRERILFFWPASTQHFARGDESKDRCENF
jgi:hypothetical protein